MSAPLLARTLAYSEPVQPNLPLLWQEAEEVLHRLLSWLNGVDPEQYGAVVPGLPHGQTAGRHIRHVLDHYATLCTALSEQSLMMDYEHRKRDTAAERCPRHAATQLADCMRQLHARIPFGDAPIHLRYHTDQGITAVSTTLARELVFLTQHSIHHFALVELLMLCQGGRVPEGFGVNPSTRRYHAAHQTHG